MTPELNRIYLGDNIATMKTWPDGFVNTCVTSPPYFGLRDYGTASWDGGDDACDHRQPLGGEGVSSGKQNTSAGTQMHQYRETCRKCGAKRIDQQIGLEATPEAFVVKLVEVFRDVRRVLRDDGTLWLNLGDSYAANRGYQVPDNKHVDVGNSRGMKAADFGLKPKDLVGIPWMVAFALRADGWYLRSDIIWHKPNPMPESVTDRPTKSHEYMFLMAKSDKYYYDHDAIKEKQTTPLDTKSAQSFKAPGGKARENYGTNEDLWEADGLRNKRSVWTVTTKPFSGAHFATFPEDLIAPCVLAGCPKDGLVLDPFMGAGTTALVSAKHSRKFIGCELNPEYKKIAENRISAELMQGKMF